jgi:hypothetical protein
MKGRHIRYSDAELAWLEEHRTMQIGWYHAAFVLRFGRHDVSEANLHSLRKRKGWRTGRTGQFVKGQPAMNKGVPCAPGRGGNHPNARRTQFRNGQEPHNTRWLGHERVSKDGYVEISVDVPNPHTGYHRRYVLKHRWLWEQANGPVPEGHALKCLDGNKQNTDPSNWEPVPRAILPRLAGGNRHQRKLAYDDAPPEVRPAIMAIAKLQHAAKVKGRGA